MISVQNLFYLTDQIALLENDHVELIKNRIDKVVQNSLIFNLNNGYSDANLKEIVEVILAILHVYKRLQMQPCQALLDVFINLDSVQKLQDVLLQNYQPDQIFELADWLVSLIGKQIWEWSSSFYPSQRPQEISFAGSTILLDQIIQCIIFSEELSSCIDISRFQVTSMDIVLEKIRSTKYQGWQEFLRKSHNCIPTNSKLKLIENQFHSRKIEHEKQIMFDQIYSGTSYRRDAIDQKHTCHLILDRETILQSSIDAFHSFSKSLIVDAIQVSFVAEDGQDRGGLTKEWCLLMVEALGNDVLIRKEEEAESMDVNPNCTEEQAFLFGIVLGIAVLCKVVLDVSLAPHFYDILVGQTAQSDLTMLAYIRPGLANGLKKLQVWNEIKQGKIEDSFSLDFTFIGENEKTINLVPNGDQKQVNASNRMEYISAVCEYFLITRTQNTMTTICAGFERVCKGITGLQLLNWIEWNTLIRGEEIANNAEALRQTCQIQMNAKTKEEKEEIQTYLALFWSIISQLSNKDFRALLHFITASHRVPSLRFSQEQDTHSRITIRVLDHVIMDNDAEISNYSLPTASTCGNTLFLPHYPSFAILERCLLLAIREGNQGFGLS